MKYTLAVFNSRFATLNFANLLKSQHIPCAIINTPPGTTHACGISVKFLSDFLPIARQILSVANQRNFDGFYCFVETNGRTKLVKI